MHEDRKAVSAVWEGATELSARGFGCVQDDVIEANLMWQARSRIRWMARQAQGETILSASCGDGAAAILMAREGRNVVGVDISRPAIDRALSERQKEAAPVAARLDFRCCDLAAMKESGFDTVVAGDGVAGEQADVSRFVANCTRLVGDKGRLLVVTRFGRAPGLNRQSAIFPRDVYSVVAGDFLLTRLDVIGGYMCMVLDRRDGGSEPDAASELLLEATERGALGLQASYHEAGTQIDALRSLASELKERLTKLDGLRADLTRQQQALSSELALKSQLAESLQLALNDAQSLVARQMRFAREHAEIHDRHAARIAELLKDIVAQKTSMKSDDKADVTELAQSLPNQLATLQEEFRACMLAVESGERALAESRTASNALQLQVRTLQAELTALRDDGDQGPRDAMESEAGTSEEIGQQLRSQLTVMEAERDLARQRADSLSEMLLEQQRANEAVARKLAGVEASVSPQAKRAEQELSVARCQAHNLEKTVSVLQDRLHTLEADYAVAQHKRSGHYLHLEAERERSRKLIPLVQELHRENQLYRQSVALEIGRAVLDLRSLRGVLRFPQVLRRAWNRHRSRGGDIVIEPLVLPRLEPVVLPPLAVKRVSTRPIDVVASVAANKPSHSTSATGATGDDSRKALSAVGWVQETRSSSVPMASVLDEFSRSCFAPHASLIEPRPDNWEALLEIYSPRLLFMESSWKGNYGTWQYRVANYANPPGREMSEMVEGFRARGIPTVFWNKEDPVHFNNFVEAASQFDVVLTTASEAVPRYQEKTSARVGVLQFAAEESLHNPVGSARRNGKVCFAGSFYANRFHERRDDQLMLLDAASAFDFDIFDRNHDPRATSRSDFAFPERFSRFVRGRMPYEAMGRAYREYSIFLNVNSVIDSPTMFSRRVFELLACGTPVVSTWSRGTEETFGTDLVWHVRDMEEAAEAIRVLLSNAAEWRRRSLAGIRAVLSQHTFKHRFAQVLDFAGLRDEAQDPFRHVLVVAEVSGQQEADAVLSAFTRQRMDQTVDKRLLLVVRGGDRTSNVREDVEVVVDSARSVATIIAESRQLADARIIARMSPLAVYGACYLQDLLHAARYSGAAIVGQPADGEESSQYQYDIALNPRSLVINEPRLREMGATLEGALANDRHIPVLGAAGGIYAANTANFVDVGVVTEPSRHVDALVGIEL